MFNLIKKSFHSKEQTKKKYFLPASKQWVFSQYNYNKDKTNDNIIKSKFIEQVVSAFVNSYSDNLLNRLKQQDELKNSWSLKKLKRRLRKQTKRLKKSLRKIVIQKPEIKSTNDFLTLNLYFYNGEKNNLIRKLFLLKNTLKKVNPWRLINEKSVFVSPLKTNFFNKLAFETGLKGNNLNFLKLKFLNRNRKQQFVNKKKIFKSKQNLNWFQKTLALLLVKKQTVLKALLFFRFLKWFVQKFGIKVYLIKVNFKFILAIKIRKIVKQIKIEKRARAAFGQKKFKFGASNRNRFIYVISKINKILFHLVLFLLSDFKLVANLFSKNKSLDVQLLNSQKNVNWKMKEISLNKVKLLCIKQDFEIFKKRFLPKLLTRTLKKEKLIFKNLIFLTWNNLKLSHFISRLQLFIQKISDNKQIKLNLISLKQVFLNANLITNALALKLKPRKASIIRVANKFLTHIKLPNSNIYFKKRLKHFINLNRTLSTSIFKISQINGKNIKISEKEIISDLKTKWIKGIKINFSGRLTKRYKASRALSKTNVKGNLTNYEKKGNNYNVMLRGDLKSNMEHSFRSSKKHIGAFGVKGWITAK